MFLSRIQLYLLVSAAFILGVLGIYASGVQRGIDKQRGQLDRARLDAVNKAKEIKDEVNADPDLAARARRWVRKDD
jgi:hypothetical protein